MDPHNSNNLQSPNIAAGKLAECKWQHGQHVACSTGSTEEKKIMGMKDQISVSICLSVEVCFFSDVCTALYVCWCGRWSAVSQFGQKVNNYSAYSVIMVPVSSAAGGRGAAARLNPSVMKYRHRGALYTWIFIKTGDDSNEG